MATHTTKAEKETFNLGKELAKTFQGGEIIGLIGDLGAGKTAFSKGIAAGLGVKNTVTSPTFVIMKVYKGKKLNLIHIDTYRIQSFKDLEGIGLEEYLGKNDAVIVIEWADKIKNELPKKTRFINFRIKNQERLISF